MKIVVNVLELRSDESGVHLDAETSSVANNDLECRIPLLVASPLGLIPVLGLDTVLAHGLD